jgi:nicotinamidase-related amidase
MALIVNKEKTAFLSMHFQNDLVCEEGKFGGMGGPAHVKQTNCLANTRRAIDVCRRKDIPVIHVVVRLQEAERTFRAELPMPPLLASIGETGAFTEGTWGNEIHEEVKPQQDELIIMGKGMNSFYANPLERNLRAMGIRTVVLSGFATNFVVESTARYACDAWFEVIILRDCCASFSEKIHSFTLDNVLPNIATICDAGVFIEALGNLL